MCSKCQHIFSFSAVEKFFAKSHKSLTDFERSRDIFIKSKPKIKVLSPTTIHKDAVPISEVSDDVIQEVIEYLGITKIDSSAFQSVHAFCHAKRKTLYFSMHDVDSNIVGYKKMSKPNDANMIETTFPETNSFGAVIFPPVAKRSRDHKTAILVVNLIDALALRMEKTNGWYHIHCVQHHEQ